MLNFLKISLSLNLLILFSCEKNLKNPPEEKNFTVNKKIIDKAKKKINHERFYTTPKSVFNGNFTIKSNYKKPLHNHKVVKKRKKR